VRILTLLAFANPLSARLFQQPASTSVGESTVLLRTSERGRFRPYSESAGQAAALIAYTRLGRSWLASGSSSEDLLRAAELYRQCTADPRRRQDSCENLKGDLEQALAEGSGKSPAPGVAEMLSAGVNRGPVACLVSASDPDFGAATEVMDAADCITSNLFGGGSPFVTGGGGATASLYDPQKDGPASLQDVLGYYNADSGNPDIDMDIEDCSSGICVRSKFYRYTYTHKGDSTATIEVGVHETTDLSGTEDQQVAVTDSNPTGQYTETYQNGNLAGVTWQGGNGGFYEASFNPDQSLASEDIIEVDEDGKVTRTVMEYDNYGNLENMTVYTSEDGVTFTCDEDRSADCDDPAKHESPSAYPDPNDIGGLCLDDPREHLPTDTSFLPWITPDPDDPGPSMLDECLEDYFDTQARTCPPSVILCLDPSSIDDCDCVESPASALRGQSICNLVDCGADASCDPATGACVAAGGGEIFPGIAAAPVFPLPDSLFSCLPSGGEGLEALRAGAQDSSCFED